jgi:hypothetical protein
MIFSHPEYLICGLSPEQRDDLPTHSQRHVHRQRSPDKTSCTDTMAA